MRSKPFWEQTYADIDAITFKKGPTSDVAEFYNIFNDNSIVLDVGCGEGRNSVFLAEQGHRVDAFDISVNGIEKARLIAKIKNAEVNFFVQNLGEFQFTKDYDVIISHGVLHLPEKIIRDRFIEKMQKFTKIGGYNVIGVFTNRLPATVDNAPFTKSLFAVGELPQKYDAWEIVHHLEGTFKDTHPGDIHHEHAFERIIAKKMK
jgi:tellurite methyltransferase